MQIKFQELVSIDQNKSGKIESIERFAKIERSLKKEKSGTLGVAKKSLLLLSGPHKASDQTLRNFDSN